MGHFAIFRRHLTEKAAAWYDGAMKKKTLVPALAALAFVMPCFGEQLAFKGGTDKNPLLYKSGETMTFTVTLVDKDLKNAPVKGRKLVWTRAGDDGKTEKGEAVSDAPLVVSTCIGQPGFVRLTVKVLGADGKPVRYGKRDVMFDGGAGADVNSIETTPLPKDFNQFWDSELAKMTTVPMDACLKEVESKDPAVCLRKFTVNMVPGEGPATGLVAWPKDAKEKSLPMYVHVTGYGFGPTHIGNGEVKKDGGQLVVSITRHGEDPQAPAEYYSNLQTNLLKGYCWRNTGTKTANDQFKMVMRDVRALAFVKTLPQWDGKSITVRGGSMGGFQSIALAALDRSVTRCVPNVPWMVDLAGHTNFKRMGGWLPGWTPELAYVDTANLATRVTCPVEMYIGLGDYICPPSGEMILFRNFKGPKTMTAKQNMGHGSVYGVESEVFTFKDEIR